jgi:hypothetical protein
MIGPSAFNVMTTKYKKAFESNPFGQTGWKNDQFVKVVESLMQRDMSLKKSRTTDETNIVKLVLCPQNSSRL